MSPPPQESDRPRKMGYQVRTSVASAVREAVQEGAAESQNAFVERALINELKAVRRIRVYQAYAEAASDPAFLEEQTAVRDSMDGVAGDGLGDERPASG